MKKKKKHTILGGIKVSFQQLSEWGKANFSASEVLNQRTIFLYLYPLLFLFLVPKQKDI